MIASPPTLFEEFFHIRTVFVDCCPPPPSLPEVDSWIRGGVPWSQELLWIFNEKCNRARERKYAENMIRGWWEWSHWLRETGSRGGGDIRVTRLPSESKVFNLKSKAVKKQTKKSWTDEGIFEILQQVAPNQMCPQILRKCKLNRESCWFTNHWRSVPLNQWQTFFRPWKQFYRRGAC